MTACSKSMDGTVAAVDRLMLLRDHCRSYCEVLDHYGPAVLGNQTWNDDRNMSVFCDTNDVKAFGKHIMSVSDEAFIVLVLVNSSARWKAEVQRDKLKVRQFVLKNVCTMITNSHICIQALNAWEDTEEERMPVSV
jgi:hypothetical protein